MDNIKVFYIAICLKWIEEYNKIINYNEGKFNIDECTKDLCRQYSTEGLQRMIKDLQQLIIITIENKINDEFIVNRDSIIKNILDVNEQI